MDTEAASSVTVGTRDKTDGGVAMAGGVSVETSGGVTLGTNEAATRGPPFLDTLGAVLGPPFFFDTLFDADPPFFDTLGKAGGAGAPLNGETGRPSNDRIGIESGGLSTGRL